MLDLELLGPDADGSHLTLADAEGRRYRLAVDDALRSVVRPARRPAGVPRPGAAGGAPQPGLRPKEIQSLLRAGVPVEEVAERAGIDEVRAESYAIPVDAERAHVAGRARDLRVGHVSDAPNLGDLVVDRLAQREVDPGTIHWDAVRRDSEPWEVVVTFVAAGRAKEARWNVDLARHVLTATDDEARWLSETELAHTSRRHLNAVDTMTRGPRRTAAPPPGSAADDGPGAGAAASPVASVPGAAGAPGAPGTEREELLAQLAASRGTRQAVTDFEDDEVVEGGVGAGGGAGFEDEAAGDAVGDDPWRGEIPGAHPAGSHPQDAPDAAVLALPTHSRRSGGGAEDHSAAAHTPEPTDQPAAPGGAPAAAATQAPDGLREPEPDAEPDTLDVPVPEARPAAKPRRKSTRRSVPSWDEIVFGTRSD